jgi:hypothetical protein
MGAACTEFDCNGILKKNFQSAVCTKKSDSDVVVMQSTEESNPEVAWAKLAALVEGARIASRELWAA